MPSSAQGASSRLEGKVIAVTGGGSGIGEASVKRLAEEGAIVVIGDIVAMGAERVAGEVVAAGGTASALQLDIADEEQFASFIAKVVDQHGGLDGIYHNAADVSAATIGGDTDAVDNTPENWQHTLDVNLTGTYYGIRHAVPHLLARGGGAIVCTASDAVYIGEPTRVAYAASKAGITTLVRHVASRWGKDGIRANAISPGSILTPALAATIPQDIQDALLAATRAPRLGLPEDVAAMAAFLLSDDALWVNGQVFNVNGGQYLR